MIEILKVTSDHAKSRKKINSIREYYLKLERYNDHLNHVMTRESSIQLVLQLSVLVDQYNSFPASDLIYDERRDIKNRFRIDKFIKKNLSHSKR